MKIKSNEISSLIKEEIKHFSRAIESNDVGTVISVGDGIALVYGLDKAMLGELRYLFIDIKEHKNCALKKIYEVMDLVCIDDAKNKIKHNASLFLNFFICSYHCLLNTRFF